MQQQYPIRHSSIQQVGENRFFSHLILLKYSHTWNMIFGTHGSPGRKQSLLKPWNYRYKAWFKSSWVCNLFKTLFLYWVLSRDIGVWKNACCQPRMWYSQVGGRELVLRRAPVARRQPIKGRRSWNWSQIAYTRNLCNCIQISN